MIDALLWIVQASIIFSAGFLCGAWWKYTRSLEHEIDIAKELKREGWLE